MLQKPKNFDDSVYLYCPRELVDCIDFNKESRKLNKGQRLSRKINPDTLKTNYIRLINFLSNIDIPYVSERKSYGYIATSKIKKNCSDKYYRICIELMMKHGILYVKQRRGGIETYEVGESTKGYRWNRTEKQFDEMGKDIYAHRVIFYKTKAKILKNIEELQAFYFCKPYMNKVVRKISKYKRPKLFGRKGRGFVKHSNDVRHVTRWDEFMVYINDKKLNTINNRKKYGIQKAIQLNYNVVLKLKYYRKICFDDFMKIARKLEDYLCSPVKGSDIIDELGGRYKDLLAPCIHKGNMFRTY